tara:strand:- start:5402 stop:5833 length:432 start_codon:yes stop_codon:yes gene_type:complete
VYIRRDIIIYLTNWGVIKYTKKLLKPAPSKNNKIIAIHFTVFLIPTTKPTHSPFSHPDSRFVRGLFLKSTFFKKQSRRNPEQNPKKTKTSLEQDWEKTGRKPLVFYSKGSNGVMGCQKGSKRVIWCHMGSWVAGVHLNRGKNG